MPMSVHHDSRIDSLSLSFIVTPCTQGDQRGKSNIRSVREAVVVVAGKVARVVCADTLSIYGLSMFDTAERDVRTAPERSVDGVCTVQ